MKALFIGGTGVISTEITKLAAKRGWEMFLLNRGNRRGRLEGIGGVTYIDADISDEENVKRALNGMSFDVVANFINFVPGQIERDIRLFTGKTGQYFFISSASAYQKPLSNVYITESTPLANPYWQYSRDKIACEETLINEYRKSGFPFTIIRPSHTYDKYSIPVGIHGKNGSWQVIKRMLDGKEILAHGDGSSLWTLTHSEDFAKGFVGLMGNIHAIGETVHITSDESLTWDQVYTCIGKALGITPKLFHISSEFIAACDSSYRGALLGDKSNSVIFDNSKLKRLVPGFSAGIRFDEGVRRSVEYHLSNKELQREDEDFDRFTDCVIQSQREAWEVFNKLYTS